MVLLFLSFGSSQSQTINILPLGNSITHSNSIQYSYRYYLWIKLLDEGVDFDFVGRQTNNRGGNPEWPPYLGLDFDQNHEGHSGWNANDLADQLPFWLTFYDPPDIALIHAGTNDVLDQETNESTIQDFKDIITILRNDNPNVIIILAQIIPNTHPFYNPIILELNEMTSSVAFDMYDINSPIYIVDQYHALNPNTDLLDDGLHPNSSGEEKMAQCWFEAINKALAGQEHGLWAGNASPDWNSSSNWMNGNTPVDSTDVFIPANLYGTYYPTSNTGVNALCDNLTIGNGAQLFISPGNSFTVNGDIVNYAGNSGIKIQSDISGTGSLIHNTLDIEATVEQYLTELSWHFIGIPVAGEYTSVFDLPNGHSEIYLRTHIEATNSWGSYIQPTNIPLLQGQGYECWVGNSLGFHQDETVTFTGFLNAGDYTTGTGSFYNLQYTSGHGLNLISNPYPSALEANIDTWAKNNIANSVWTWSDTYGNYVYWGSGNDYGSGNFGSMTDGVIPAMQGFFVEATGASPFLTLPQTDRIHSNQEYYKESAIPANTLKLEVDGNNYKDIAFVSFNNNATDEFDRNYDVKKLFGLDEAPQLYSITNDENMSINALPFNGNSRITDMGFESGLSGNFTFKASGLENFTDPLDVFLEDIEENTLVNLKENPLYQFSHEPGITPLRFRLHFINPNSSFEQTRAMITIFSDENIIYIRNPEYVNCEVSIFNLTGQEVLHEPLTNANIIKLKLNSGPGVYIVKVKSVEVLTTGKVYLH